MKAQKAKVGIIMGSDSDWPVMKEASRALEQFRIPFEVAVVSAHRTPEEMQKYAKSAQSRGLEVIIAGAGGAAHLPGMVASLTTLPVIGVPIQIGKMNGLDSLLSIVQMPKGIPVATVAVDNGFNGGLLATRILALNDKRLYKALTHYVASLKTKVRHMNKRLKTKV